MRLLNEITNHKLDWFVYFPSVGVTLANDTSNAKLVTSLKELPFFDTGLSLSVVVEIGAGFGVFCMLVHYGYRFANWVDKRRG